MVKYPNKFKYLIVKELKNTETRFIERTNIYVSSQEELANHLTAMWQVTNWTLVAVVKI